MPKHQYLAMTCGVSFRQNFGESLRRNFGETLWRNFGEFGESVRQNFGENLWRRFGDTPVLVVTCGGNLRRSFGETWWRNFGENWWRNFGENLCRHCGDTSVSADLLQNFGEAASAAVFGAPAATQGAGTSSENLRRCSGAQVPAAWVL